MIFKRHRSLQRNDVVLSGMTDLRTIKAVWKQRNALQNDIVRNCTDPCSIFVNLALGSHSWIHNCNFFRWVSTVYPMGSKISYHNTKDYIIGKYTNLTTMTHIDMMYMQPNCNQSNTVPYKEILWNYGVNISQLNTDAEIIFVENAMPAEA